MSLFGGDSTTTTSLAYNYSAELAPQSSQQGAAPGDSIVNITPLDQGGDVGPANYYVAEMYAPVNITSTGNVLGDSAINAITAAAQAQQAQPVNGNASTISSVFSSLFSGDNIYYLIAGFILLLLAHQKG